VPYLRGLLLTGTLAMKRGGSNSDWDVLVVLKKDRIWLGRLIFTAWLQLVGKRRHGQKIENKFCLNQFVVDKKLKFKEKNEFFSNELLMAEDLMGDVKLKNKIMEKNEKWIKRFKPNFKFRKRKIGRDRRKFLFLKMIQRKLESVLEVFNLAEMINSISKKVMIHKIINNPKTYSPGADIRYSDFFLVFLPKPQRMKVKRRTIELLTKMNL
jgi:predicted nucleotidyltransferase